MSTSEVLLATQQYGIEIVGSLDFLSKKESILLLSILEKLKKEDITISLLNEDLIYILLSVTLDEKNLKTLRQINWDDFDKMFKDHSTKRREKIYQNYMEYLRNELGVVQHDEELTTENTLLENTAKKNTPQRNHYNKRIYDMDEHFNVKEDLIEKSKKFGVGIEFDYIEEPKKLGVADFTLYFNRRLQYFTELLSSRVAAENVVRISQLKDLYSTNTEVTLIGLISEITQTNKGHIMLTLEDKSGQIKCFINKDKQELMNFVGDFCLDEGIGIRGKVGDNIIWTDEIIIPSPPMNAELKKTEEEHYVAFLSDIHFGAKVFQDEAFQKFLDFVNGETSNEKLNALSKKLKSIIIAGDLIEGIGIYPNQGKDARILSTEKQYHECARWLSQIPKHISIIIIPGNHDTDRLSEPQPKLPYHKAYALYNMENVLMISNPGIIRLFEDDPSGGLTFYIYHGGSYFYYGDKIQRLREKGGMKVPEEIVKFLLEKRHLAPSHGATLYIPDSQNDPLVIRKMPDFFITGHTHKLSLANYKGCTIVSCGCWVEMSDYQEKMGMYPDVGKVPIVNTKTRKPHLLNFYTEEYKKKND